MVSTADSAAPDVATAVESVLDADVDSPPKVALGALSDDDLRDVLDSVVARPGGVRSLVRLRERLLERPDHDAQSDTVEHVVGEALRGCFEPDQLHLRAITADADQHLLDRLVEYEAVHPIRNRDDLLRRLHPTDRRCFGLFHPELGDDPVVFVEVALTVGIEASVQAILNAPPTTTPDPATDTAIFYSINNCHDGLRGIPFGAELLHRVLGELEQIDSIRHYSTLSPIPGFARWLAAEPEWEQHDLLSACATYLLTAKRGDRPLDPVARFHLGNGARLERLNPGGDTSERGRARYHGVTANYVYAPDDLATNQLSYAEGVVVASDAVHDLVRP